MRFRFMLALLALGACGKPAQQTPPIHAPAPAPQADPEAPPGDRLPGDTHPESYSLALALDPAQRAYRGSVAIDVMLERPRSSIWLHSRGPRAARVVVEREGSDALAGTLEPVGASGLVALRLAQPVGPGRVRVRIDFEADYGSHLTGLYRAEAGGKPYLFTQFEPISAREAFPCFDEPRFKTPFELTLRIPKGLVAIANTMLREQRALDADTEELVFARTEKLPTYLVALAVGPLDVVPGPALEPHALRDRAVPFRGVAVAGRGGDLTHVLGETGPLVTWLERYFGVGYPYDKLDLIAVPDFGAGAMENAGAITFRDTLLLVRPDAPEQQKRGLAYVNAHELAHQWFGNLVTMPWWDDIWLNEAFATWMGMRAVGAVHPEYEPELGAISATHGAMELDSRKAARKIRQPIESDHDIESAFDAITYSKGGAVLSMFERYLGAETFQRGLSVYMERYRFGNATARDLVRTLSEVSQKPELETAFFSFLDQPGVPELQVQLRCDKGAKPVVTIAQRRYLPLGSSADPGGRWRIPVCMRYGDKPNQAREQCMLVSEPEQQVELEGACPRWLFPNAGAQGYYRWALADESLDALVRERLELTVPEQMSLANNVVAAFRAGRIDAKRALAAERALAGSPKRHVLDSALRMYGLAYELLDAPHWPALRKEVAAVLRPAYQKVGLLPRASAASGEEKLLRAALVRALYGLAEEPAITRELARLGRARLEGKSNDALPSELVELALSAAVREGGAATFDRASEQLFAASDGMVRGRLLSALASVREPALSDRVLALALDPRLRTNERLLPLFGQSAMPESRERAFLWLQANFDAMVSQLGAHGGNDLIGTMGGFCSEPHAQQVEAYFGPRSANIPGGPRELALTLEAIRNCAALRERYGEELRGIFSG
jgi:cytosol alanyl aminopeptidase